MRPRRRVVVITGTRAEYGLLRSTISAIADQPRLELQLVATGMHLLRKFGRTVRTIEEDGWRVNARVPMQRGNDDSLDQARGLSRGVSGIAAFLESAKTDVVLVLGDRIEAMAGASRTGYGTGGMVTKLAAARSALAAGCAMVITDGKVLNPLKAVENGARCTWFTARQTPRTARKHWIAGSLKPVGSFTLDPGACKALNSGKSLLPAGVTMVKGSFSRGDAVTVLDADGREIGRGLSAYSAPDAALIMGHKSSEIEDILGYRGRDEMIHRDDLVLT